MTKELNKRNEVDIRIEYNTLTVEDYQSIRSTTDWDVLEGTIVEKAISNDFFSICIYDKDRLIGIGRVIGDGAIYFYIQDVIVLPKYQKYGIGKLIMENIEEYLLNVTSNNSVVGLMAAEGVSQFYKKFGYKTRSKNKPGMCKKIKKK